MSERFDDAVNALSMAWRASDGRGSGDVSAARAALEVVYADEKAEAREESRAALAALVDSVSALWCKYAADEMRGLDEEWAEVGRANAQALKILGRRP